jgi:murein DD-endopeptidase MepM/ murein hydrolase activator NlpD
MPLGGLIQSFGTFTNFVAITNANEEYSRYDHLAPQSSKVKVGQAVCEGQEIAKVGMTGYTPRPHLHFQIFIFTRTNSSIDFDTVSVQDFISNYLYIIECATFLSTLLLLHRQRMKKSRRQRQSTRFYSFIFVWNQLRASYRILSNSAHRLVIY